MDVIYGGAGNDTLYAHQANGTDTGPNWLYGEDGNDILRGSLGADYLDGGNGNDDIQGGNGDDILIGGRGNDILWGQIGNDTYIYNAGDGHDTIREQGSGTGNDNDRILFGADITLNDLTFRRVSSSNLLIEIDNGVDEPGSILIENQFNYAAGGGHVEWLAFDDESTLRLDEQEFVTYGTDGDDVLHGTNPNTGGSAIDVIYGGAGNDTLYIPHHIMQHGEHTF